MYSSVFNIIHVLLCTKDDCMTLFLYLIIKCSILCFSELMMRWSGRNLFPVCLSSQDKCIVILFRFQRVQLLQVNNHQDWQVGRLLTKNCWLCLVVRFQVRILSHLTAWVFFFLLDRVCYILWKKFQGTLEIIMCCFVCNIFLIWNGWCQFIKNLFL